MFAKALLAAILLFVQSVLFSQKIQHSFSKEISFVTENDNYNFTKYDRYYTNGIFVHYNWLQKNNTKPAVAKIINRAEAGQMIYNSYKNQRSNTDVLATLDRPYTAWLYGSFGKTKIFHNQDVLLYDVTVGVIGPAALGKQVQTGYHKFMGLYKVYGWNFQLNNEVGLNASAQYYHSLLAKDAKKNISLHAVAKAGLGNTFTNATAGLLLKFGKINREDKSAYWGGQLGNNTNEQKHLSEAVFFLEPVVEAQAYNATVEGALFKKDKGYYTSPLNPIIYMMKGGFLFSWQKTAFSIVYTVKEREATSMIDKVEVYGAFGFTFRFH